MALDGIVLYFRAQPAGTSGPLHPKYADLLIGRFNPLITEMRIVWREANERSTVAAAAARQPALHRPIPQPAGETWRLTCSSEQISKRPVGVVHPPSGTISYLNLAAMSSRVLCVLILLTSAAIVLAAGML